MFQYIQYPLIAKDFANYLELYYKYEKDYQVEAILDGQVKEAVYSRLERAPFDERMSVISLVLAALNSGFQSLQEKGRRLERLETRRQIQRPRRPSRPPRRPRRRPERPLTRPPPR